MVQAVNMGSGSSAGEPNNGPGSGSSAGEGNGGIPANPEGSGSSADEADGGVGLYFRTLAASIEKAKTATGTEHLEAISELRALTNNDQSLLDNIYEKHNISELEGNLDLTA